MNRREFLTLGAACAVAGGCATGKTAKEARPCTAFDEETRHVINALRPLWANVAMPVWGDRIV